MRFDLCCQRSHHVLAATWWLRWPPRPQGPAGAKTLGTKWPGRAHRRKPCGDRTVGWPVWLGCRPSSLWPCVGTHGVAAHRVPGGLGGGASGPPRTTRGMVVVDPQMRTNTHYRHEPRCGGAWRCNVSAPLLYFAHQRERGVHLASQSGTPRRCRSLRWQNGNQSLAFGEGPRLSRQVQPNTASHEGPGRHSRTTYLFIARSGLLPPREK